LSPPPDHGIEKLPAIPPNEEGPVFREPWEAQAFALAVRLHETGLFTWPEWAEALGAEIAKAGSADDYYHCWLTALEALLATKGIVSPETLRARQEAWDRAARATPHGQPIVL
jgi:nitrile hydratase accessory protein